MAKKVTLDTLDIEETSVSIQVEAEPTEEDEPKAPVSRFPSAWLRPIPIGITVAVLSGTLLFSYWMWFSKAPPQRHLASKASVPASLPVNPNIQAVSDLFIPLKADKGSQRMVMVDLVFELNNGQQALFMQNMVRIRSGIYQTFNRKTADVVVARGSLEVLKAEMMAELEKHLGKERIKNIYFTKFIVL